MFHDFYQKIRDAQNILMLTTDRVVIVAKEENDSVPAISNVSLEGTGGKSSTFNEYTPIDQLCEVMLSTISVSPETIRPKMRKATTKKRVPRSLRDDEKLLQYFEMRCNECVDERGEKLQFSSADANRKHFKTVHKLMYRCNGVCRRCNVLKTSTSKMREHILWHDKPDEFQCKICFKFASNQYNLRQHELIHLENEQPNDGNFECDLCSKRMATKEAICGHMQRKHMKRLKSVKRISASCDKCGKE